MKLSIFDRTNSSPKTSKTGVRSLYFTRKTGAIMLSSTLKNEERIDSSWVCFIAQDEDSPKDWYIAFSQNTEDGFQLREKKNGQGTDATLMFCNRFITGKLLDTFKIQKSATFLISEKHTYDGGLNWFKIVTAKPLKQS